MLSCSCKTKNYDEVSNSKTNTKDVFYEGKITVVGNEPFSKLGLMVNDSTIYILECDKETEDSLLKNQGKFYKIFFDQSKAATKSMTLVVIKTEKNNN